MKQKQNNLKIKSILKTTTSTILGVDEVGRGCIAGPVCAGVVIFRPESQSDLSKYVDSKTIKENIREARAKEILNEHYSALGWSSVEEVDELNIRQASLLAMNRAVTELFKKYKFKKTEVLILVDGLDTVPNIDGVEQHNVIKGDQLVRQISAASIIAKVARDTLMKEVSLEYSEYGFEKHKGYGTEAHRKAIQKYGVTTYHRKSFGGVKEHL